MSYVVVGTDKCEFCTKAKNLLRERGVGFTAYSLSSQSSKWLLTLIKQAGMTTVPQIWDNNGDYIGGYTELKEKLEC
jgi:glutaredoxin